MFCILIFQFCETSLLCCIAAPYLFPSPLSPPSSSSPLPPFIFPSRMAADRLAADLAKDCTFFCKYCKYICAKHENSRHKINNSVESLYLFMSIDQAQTISGVATWKDLKGLRIAKIKNCFILAPAQRNWMQPILLSYEAAFRSNLQKKHWSSELHAAHCTTGSEATR